MAEHPRIEELRRRVQKDKASIAFAQLAEEYRRAGRFQEAVDTCRTGLSHHPGYLSAHVTLGRALIEVGELQQAEEELQRVLAAAPENLAALKGVADIHHRRGEAPEALAHFRRALELAPHDPDLEHLVGQMARELEPARFPAVVPDGLSFEEAVGEFLALENEAAPAPAAADPLDTAGPLRLAPNPPAAGDSPAAGDEPVSSPQAPPPVDPEPPPTSATASEAAVPPPDTPASPLRAVMEVEALERWLDAILADRQTPR